MYFPTSGVASVVGRVGGDWQEIGLFGQDGAGCLSGSMGTTKPPYLIIMQVPGAGYRISAAAFAQAFAEDADFRGVMLRYVQAFVIQVAQSSIANCQYNTVQRMALWLLMLHDRMDGNSLCLTHEYIASTLGVGRTGVTLALHSLEESGMIRTARKRITIVSRERLEAMTAAVYGFAEAEYRKLLGPLRAPHQASHAAAG